MAIRVALHHKTTYHYDRLVTLSPQIVRLRPAPHSRTPIHSYSLKIQPAEHFINWQQDPHSNYLARLVFPKLTRIFSFEVDLIVDMTAFNALDFFLDDENEHYPFVYEPALKKELAGFLETLPVGPHLKKFLATVDLTRRRTIPFLSDLNISLQRMIGYVIRMEPGVQTCEETLEKRKGSCRDSAWLLV